MVEDKENAGLHNFDFSAIEDLDPSLQDNF